ncbi:alpha/beta hydrolase [Nocardiopsis composta]
MRPQRGELLPHLSSTAAAHDLDLVRAALGEERLNFFGMSQAGLIGTVYADLYPERVRALVLDSPVDATRRTTRPLEYDRARAQGHEEALGAALELCAEAGDRCPFGGGDPRAAMTEIRDRLYQGPVEMPDGEVVTLGKLVTELRSALGVMPALSPVPLDGVFQRLAELHGQAGGPPSGAPGPGAAPAPPRTRPTTAAPSTGSTAPTGPTPPTRGGGAAARQWEQEYPVFGRAQAYEQFPACASWPAPPESPYPGPSEPRTEEPPLVLSNRHDAPTPPAFAERMAGALDGRLIVVEDAFGHGALGTSRCADDAVTAYLTRLQAPPEESVCAPDDAPWPEGSA